MPRPLVPEKGADPDRRGGGDQACRRHRLSGIPGVGQQVQDHLLQGERIRLHVREAVAQLLHDLQAARPELRTHHPHGRRHHLVHLRGAHLGLPGLACEHPHVLDDVRHPVCLIHDQLRVLFQFLLAEVPASVEPDHKVLRQAAYPRKRLVQFVGDAGSHLAQGPQPIQPDGNGALFCKLQFGGAPGGLGLFPGGDIGGDAVNDDLTILLSPAYRAIQEPPPLAVGPPDPVLDLEGLTGLEVRNDGIHFCKIVRVDGIVPQQRPRLKL